MCLNQKNILNRKYLPNKKNGGEPPILKDIRKRTVEAKCGYCSECLRQKVNQWRIRMTEEYIHNPNAIFVTLTLSDNDIENLRQNNRRSDNDVATRAVRLFLERWRKKHRKSLRHWLVTEIGTNNTKRIHLHGILWTTDKTMVQQTWQYGFTKELNFWGLRTINYVVKYMLKENNDFKPKVLCSPGIGKEFTNSINAKLIKQRKNQTYKLNNGKVVRLPQYYKLKIFNENERDEMWTSAINEDVRYLNRTKFDLKQKGKIQEYQKAVMYHRQLDKNNGYTKPTKTK